MNSKINFASKVAGPKGEKHSFAIHYFQILRTTRHEQTALTCIRRKVNPIFDVMEAASKLK